MKLCIFGLLLAQIASPLMGADLIIDDFSYPSSAEAQAAWSGGPLYPPVEMAEGEPYGERVMVMNCDFTQDVARNTWDRTVSLDLTAHQSVTLRVFSANPSPIRSITLYFQSGDGWYAESFGISDPGWTTVRLGLDEFSTEDTPAGWDQINRIRISPWKELDEDTSIAIADLRASSPPIRTIGEFYSDHLPELLTEMDLWHSNISEAEILADRLSAAQVLFMAHSTSLSNAAWDKIDTWIAGGGRLIAFYSLPTRMANTLGLAQTGWRRDAMGAMNFDAPDVEGLPPTVYQTTWNITEAVPNRPDARIIATWERNDGTPLTDAAWILSDTGAWMSHVLTTRSDTHRQMLLALLGQQMPHLWPDAAAEAISLIGNVGPHTGFTPATASIEAEATNTPRLSAVQAWISSSEWQRDAALAAQASGEYPTALDVAIRARQSLREAYYHSRESSIPEIRAAWEHSGLGPYAGDWPRSIQALADAGFTDVVPNMLWGGSAHFDSEVLPTSSGFADYGDQIAQCVAAAHAQGLGVHVWKVNWNLGSGASPEFIASLRAADRLQVGIDDSELDWLCPSNPLNLALERDSMIEVARNYDVDGLHFDYIRYPGPSYCYCDPCRSRFETQTEETVTNWPTDCHGDGIRADEYRDWRVEQITALVRSVRASVEAENLDVEISAAVFRNYPSCRNSVGQDWAAWIDEGLLDFICPMDYINSPTAFHDTLESQTAIIQGRIPFVPGIGVSSSSSGLTPDKASWQVEITRSLNTEGFILFQLNAALAEQTLPAFGLGLTAPPSDGLILN